MQKGTKAPQAAGRIHTDFEKGFIMAEVFKFADLKEEGSEAAVKVSIIIAVISKKKLLCNAIISLGRWQIPATRKSVHC